jgi:predicted RNase H-like HicB family nuclease
MEAHSRRYLVVVEKSESGYGAFSPDVPGCFAVGATELETLQRFHEALQDHLELLAESGEQLPEPSTMSVTLDVRLPVVA